MNNRRTEYWTRAGADFWREASAQFPVLLLTGPRQVGKTTLLRTMAGCGRSRLRRRRWFGKPTRQRSERWRGGESGPATAPSYVSARSGCRWIGRWMWSRWAGCELRMEESQARLAMAVEHAAKSGGAPPFRFSFPPPKPRANRQMQPLWSPNPAAARKPFHQWLQCGHRGAGTFFERGGNLHPEARLAAAAAGNRPPVPGRLMGDRWDGTGSGAANGVIFKRCKS